MKETQKIVFLSNNLTHHQAPFSDALWELTDGNYTFVETSVRARERQLRGESSSPRQYVLNYWGNEEKVKKKIKEADVVISGSAPEFLVQERVQAGKLLLRYSERPLKKGFQCWRYPDRFLRWHWRNPFWKPIYMLCASAYTAPDYRKFGLFKNKTYKWGYFPETRWYSDIDALMAAKDPTEILWCGRFLDWKHPDDAIRVAWELKKKGYRFHMNFIGAGVMEPQINSMIQEYQLEDCVTLLGKMTTEQVRVHMEKTGIYLFTSDRQEGWGAVLNESMNSGCAVIASNTIGSVPYLIEDGINGMVYESGNIDMLCEKVKSLLECSDEQKRMGLAAYRTIAETWNAQIAAERLLELSGYLLNGNIGPASFKTGPCSKAD